MAQQARRFTDADTLARMRTLELHARGTVEGWLSGMHRSPQHGFAVEFAQHREYSPGDDIRHIDWKVFARTERFYLKQYEQETNLVTWLLVDSSESMRYASGGVSKYDYACRIAASLGWLVLNQADSLGMLTWDTQVRSFLKPSSASTQLRDLIAVLMDGPGGDKTGLDSVLREVGERLKRRGIVMIFSDLLDEIGNFAEGLRQLVWQGHEVIVFQILDPAELTFPFRDPTLFKGMEEWPEMLTDPLSIRESYLRELNAHLEAVETTCRESRTDFLRLRTDEDAGLRLAEYLNRRMR